MIEVTGPRGKGRVYLIEGIVVYQVYTRNRGEWSWSQESYGYTKQVALDLCWDAVLSDKVR